MIGSTIGGAEFAALLAGALENLRGSADEINESNVFPVMDGDTGDNMIFTLSCGAKSAKDCVGGVGEVAEHAARGMLLGARGNSGIILAQLFSGIANSLAGKTRAGVSDFAEAFGAGVKQAYSALSYPSEGTMLTVMRLAADYARDNCRSDAAVEDYFALYKECASRTLQNTPNLLPVLKDTGTVDSGGAGLLCIICGFLSVLRGEFSYKAHAQSSERSSSSYGPDISLFTENSELALGYRTEFMLRLTRKKTDIDNFSIDDFRKKMSYLGNSSEAFRHGSIVKVNVRTMEPWRVLQFAQRYGEFLTAKVENMSIYRGGATHKTASSAHEFIGRAARKAYGIVAAAAGAGMCSAFRELGADIVIDCDKYGLLTAELFTSAIEAANADCVFVLPDDKNAVAAAEEAAGMLKTSIVRVLPTFSFGEGYVALSSLDCESGNADEIFSNMNDEVGHSACGSVVRATYAENLGGAYVNESDYIGISNNNILCSSPDKTEAALSLAKLMGAAERDFIIVFCGADVTSDERSALRDKVCSQFSSAEYYEIDGGQKTYDFIIVLQ